MLAQYLIISELDTSAALRELGNAVELNPHSSRAWLDFATVYQITGKLAEQQAALEQAVRLDPTTPDVLWQAAMFNLVSGNSVHALELLRDLVKHDPSKTASALEVAWRATGHQVQPLIEAGLPLPSLLQFVVDRKETEAADKVWARVGRYDQPFQPSHAFSYIQLLLQHQRAEQAEQVWRYLVRQNPSLQAYMAPDSLVINGDFEQPILPSGLDWWFDPPAGVTLELDNAQFHSANHSLAVHFQSAAVTTAGVFHNVPVRPNSCYEFAGFMKTEDLEGAEGPRLSLTDAYSSELYYLSAAFYGSTPWREETGLFRTGPRTTLLRISIAMAAAQHVKGTVWLDAVRLSPRAQEQCPNAPTGGRASSR